MLTLSLYTLCFCCVLQAAAKLASGLVSTVWHVVDDMVVTPALQVSSQDAKPVAGLRPAPHCAVLWW